MLDNIAGEHDVFIRHRDDDIACRRGAAQVVQLTRRLPRQMAIEALNVVVG